MADGQLFGLGQRRALTGNRPGVNLADWRMAQQPAFRSSVQAGEASQMRESEMKMQSDKLQQEKEMQQEAQKQAQTQTGISTASTLGTGLYGAHEMGYLGKAANALGLGGAAPVAGVAAPLPGAVMGGTGAGEALASGMMASQAPTAATFGAAPVLSEAAMASGLAATAAPTATAAAAAPAAAAPAAGGVLGGMGMGSFVPVVGTAIGALGGILAGKLKSD
ncbi:MAG: hypothetical protein PHQ43_02410 [Dehalococcoidales bacterium]|nr:hypothetical protein [Dehalococcoidales bacterium]